MTKPRSNTQLAKKSDTRHRTRSPRKTRASARPDDYVVAQHEAAHAVVAYWFGGWVDDRGVTIVPDQDFRGRAWLGWHLADISTRASITVALAGPLQGPLAIQKSVDTASLERMCKEEPVYTIKRTASDEEHVVALLKETKPSANVKQLVASCRRYELETRRLLDRSGIAASIGRVADALVKHHTLGDKEIWPLLSEGVRQAAGRARWKFGPTLRERKRYAIDVDSVKIPKGQRELQDGVVEQLVASIEADELLYPIGVRRDGKHGYVLVYGGHRLEAHRRLGRPRILANILDGLDDVAVERLRLAENFARAELTPLERAEAVKRWLELADKPAQGAQVSRGGRGRKGGVAQAARDLGTDRREVQRSLQVAERITPEAKKEAKRLGLDKNQRDLLEIANAPEDLQVGVAQAIAGDKRAVAERNRAVAKAKDEQVRSREQAWRSEVLRVWAKGQPQWRSALLPQLAD